MASSFISDIPFNRTLYAGVLRTATLIHNTMIPKPAQSMWDVPYSRFWRWTQDGEVLTDGMASDINTVTFFQNELTAVGAPAPMLDDEVIDSKTNQRFTIVLVTHQLNDNVHNCHLKRIA